MTNVYEAIVDVFFSDDGDAEPTVITLEATGKNADEARENLEQDILDGKIEMPDGYESFYIWEIAESDLLEAS